MRRTSDARTRHAALPGRTALALALALGGAVRAQDTPPAPPADERPGAAAAAPGEDVSVERPEELARIRAELERLQAERARGAARVLELEARERDLTGGRTSPVLGPRREVLALSLDAAVDLALAENPDYLVELLRAQAAGEQAEQAEAAFDPVLSVQASYTEGRPPFFSLNPFAGFPLGLSVASFDQLEVQTALSKRFALGTTASITWLERRQLTENIFQLNPSYTPQLRVELRQPLLRGAGLEANLAPVRLAENAALAADMTYAEALLGGVLAVEQAYWDLVRAEEELRFQERSYASAQKLLEDQRRRQEVGAAATLDVIIAQAGLAERREGLIVAENALEAARDGLVRLVRPSGDAARWDVLIVPTDRPWQASPADVDLTGAVELARARRPDLKRAHVALDSARRTAALRENEALPVLDVFGSLTEDGLGGQHHNAWSSLGSGRFYSWTFGLRAELPLFLRAERARSRAARLELAQAEAALRSAEANAVLDVRRAVRDVRTAEARIEAARAARILSARQLQATYARVDQGTAVARDVLDDLARLALAEGREVQSHVDHRLARSRLARAQGTLLDARLGQLDPRVRRALLEDGEVRPGGR